MEPGVKQALRPYQVQALEFLRGRKRANLFAEMGLGKTLTVLTLIAESRLKLPTLVLAPLRVARKTWSDEVQDWAHLRHLKVATITGTPAERLAALKTPAHVHTMNYEQAEWLLDTLGQQWPFGMVVADESTRLKSFRLRQGGKRAAALGKIAHRTERWINLTGTPMSNGLLDLWGQQWFIDAGAALGRSFSAFETRWFYKPPRGDEHTRPQPFQHAQGQIEEAMRPTTLSIRSRDWFDLEEPIRVPVLVELPPDARREYKRMARELYAQLQDGTMVSALNAATKSGKLLQLASGAVYREDKSWAWVHDEKIEALRSIVEEAAGAPLLVAYNYVHEVERILKAFPWARVLRTKKDEDDWNEGKIQMLVAHPDSAGHGLNLQHGGNRLVYFGHTWKQEAYAQILERIGPVRQLQSGYKRPVFVYSIIAQSTLDGAVIQRNEGKADMMSALMTSLRASI